jgi:hypothetical protein
LSTIAVDQDRPFDQLGEEDRRLRRALRAKARQLGGNEALVSEVAYQQWHRMLFARFLAENHLLMHPQAGVPVSLEEVAELAQEEGEPDNWALAARYAARMLPAIFRSGDPELSLRFAPEGRQRLEELLQNLSTTVFLSDDGLGWVYQFWQSEKKQQVNRSGVKIGASELPAVTQLFTEEYMVRFLLENTLGAWWAGRHPKSPLLEHFEYLRWSESGQPAAGTYEGWPQRAADITVMDPCCGSAHFLTVSLEMLIAMRVEEEGLSTADAGDAVIEQNLFGLEIDFRCTQIAAFAIALAAWRSGGYRQLPPPNIACSGVGVAGQLVEWTKLAGGDSGLENALAALHEQFRNAPELGSLIDPRRITEEGHLFAVDYEKVAPLLDELLLRGGDIEAQVAGWAAAGIARAAALLARTYTLVVTNPPFLGRGDFGGKLMAHVDRQYEIAKEDLATAFVLRARDLVSNGATVSMVTPQNWFFLRRFEDLRGCLFAEDTWRIAVQLGEGAFESSQAAGAFVGLVAFSRGQQVGSRGSEYFLLLAVDSRGTSEKASRLRSGDLEWRRQDAHDKSGHLVFGPSGDVVLLGDLATSWQGLVTTDVARFTVQFWEVREPGPTWVRFVTAPASTAEYAGRDTYLRWEQGRGSLQQSNAHNFNPDHVLGRRGVLIAEMRSLRAALYLGEMFNQASVPIIPFDESILPALWSFCSSPEFNRAVRVVNQKVSVGSGYFLKVPFDLEHWTKVAQEQYANGLPQPYSNDPTQWLFRGDLVDSTDPLQVAVARLLGYVWPDQRPDALDELVDAYGVVPIPPIAGEEPAAQRLRDLLGRAWGEAWSTARLSELLVRADSPGKDLETWLRDSFFTSHAKLFRNRPFIWHIWDGRHDGFSALVNYHKLDGRLLSRITHTLLGSWIEVQHDQVRTKTTGAEGRLAAARELQRKLELIAEGEPPYDLYVRWKPLASQPIGWAPDLDDGVRLNIRPFVEAGVIRTKLAINWKTDRGSNPDGSDRANDRHLTRAEKLAARSNVSNG